MRPETGGLTLTGSLTDDETQHPMDPEALGGDVGIDEAAPSSSGRRARCRGSPKALPPGLGGRVRHHAGLDADPRRDRRCAGLWVAAGMSGHGFKLAPAVGEMMAALITGAAPPVSPTPFRLERFAGAAAAGTFVASYLS